MTATTGENSPEQRHQAPRRGGRPRLTQEQMIKNNRVSAETAELCRVIQELIERAGFDTHKEFHDYATQHGWRGARSTHYDKLSGRKRFDEHELKTIVRCCAQRSNLDEETQETQIKRLGKLWDAARGREAGQPADVAPVSAVPPDSVANLAESTKNLTELLRSKNEEVGRLRTENDRLRGQALGPFDATPPVAPASKAGSPPSTDGPPVVDGEVLDASRGTLAEGYFQLKLATASIGKSGRGPDSEMASFFRRLYGPPRQQWRKPPRVFFLDSRRVYLCVLLLGLLTEALYWAQSRGGWTWLLPAAFGVILAVVLPAELHRHRFQHVRSLPSDAVAMPRLRWPGRPQIAWYLSPTDTHPTDPEVPGVHTTFLVAPTRRPLAFPGYLPRDGSVGARRLTGQLCLSNCSPGTSVYFSIVDVDNGRVLAEDILPMRRRTCLSEYKFDGYPHLRVVGIRLNTDGPVKVSWLSPGVSEWSDGIDWWLEMIDWWFEALGGIIDAVVKRVRRSLSRLQEYRYNRMRKRAYATLRRRRPDLPPVLQGQRAQRALENSRPVQGSPLFSPVGERYRLLPEPLGGRQGPAFDPQADSHHRNESSEGDHRGQSAQRARPVREAP